METTAEPSLEHQQNTANGEHWQAKPKAEPRKWLFTKENARALALKSLESRRLKQAQERLDKAKLEKEAQIGRNLLMADAIREEPAPATENGKTYVAKQLVCVREHLDRLDKLIAKETEPASLDRLVSAQSKLREQERILDNRPLPGSRRPSADKTARDLPSTGPVED